MDPGAPLEALPGIGPRLADSLRELGFACVGDLRGQDPEALYTRLCDQRRERIDPCVLYCYRCAVFVAENPAAGPAQRNWWYWKGRRLPGPRPA